jgi:hypothetical protein
MQDIKSIVKLIVPAPLMKYYRTWKLARFRKVNYTRPIKEVFTRVYEEHQWGGGSGEYCSGSGSSFLHASGYAAVVKQLIEEKGITTVVDLGCGDFVVGKALQTDGVKYIGIDIVDGLIRRNQGAYGDINTQFLCLDMVMDQLPDGDLCLIRQVLQHLSNLQIVSVLQNTMKYRYVLVTEHYPAPFVKYRPNLDKPHGPDTRIYDNSAVYLDRPPFNVSPQSITLVSDIDAQTYLVHKGERFRMFLIENKPND